MTRIACIGEAMIELAVADPPTIGVAGDTLNTAIYLKRAAPDLEVHYISRLGTDSFSDKIRDTIKKHGIEQDRMELSQHRIPGLYAITTKDGERSFTYWRDQSAAKDLFQTPSGLDFSPLDGFDVLYLSAITLAILPDTVREALLDYISKSTAKLAFDSNYRPKLWPNRQVAERCIAKWWEAADIALPSIDDEMELTQSKAEKVEARFLKLGKQGALKRGASGPLSLGPESVAAQTFPPAKKVVDTTAAGDSFNGAYLGALLSGANQADALMAGHRCAAHVVGFKGAIVPA